jgi:Kef-type K+ transport system membrane component KefB
MAELQLLLLQLLAIFVAAQIGSEVAQRLGLPSVVGEIAGGMLIGPSVLGWVPLKDGHAPMPFELLAEIGVVFLMFSVGLETRLSSLRSIGKVAISVATLGVLVPFFFGLAWAASMGFPLPKQMFVATAFVATSVAITARVLTDLGALKRKEAKVILAAAVLDDILAMLLLGAVAAIQPADGTHKGNAVFELLFLAAQAAAFFIALTVFLPKVMRRHHQVIEAPISPHSPFILSIVLCLGVSVLAAQIGLAAIIGAFLAGTLFAEVSERYGLSKQLSPLLSFLAPFFFVVTGMKVDLAVFASWGAVGMVATVTVLAIIGKLVGCGIAARSMGTMQATIVGVGMSPRGEVGILIAALGLSRGVFDNEVYAILIAMSLLTSVFAPPMLAYLLRKTEIKPAETTAGSTSNR